MALSEEAANDSDKALDFSSVLGGYALKIDGIRIEFVATATVGTREFTIEIRDATPDVIWSMNLDAGTAMVAGETETTELMAGLPVMFLTAIDGGPHHHYLPELWLHAGMDLRVYDRNAIDAAADDMVLHVRGHRY